MLFGAQSPAPRDDTRRSACPADEFHAEFTAQAPYNPALLALVGARSGQRERERLRHIDIGIEPRAALGDISDDAFARQRADAAVIFCDATDDAAGGLTAILQHGESHYIGDTQELRYSGWFFQDWLHHRSNF